MCCVYGMLRHEFAFSRRHKYCTYLFPALGMHFLRGSKPRALNFFLLDADNLETLDPGTLCTSCGRNPVYTLNKHPVATSNAPESPAAMPVQLLHLDESRKSCPADVYARSCIFRADDDTCGGMTESRSFTVLGIRFTCGAMVDSSIKRKTHGHDPAVTGNTSSRGGSSQLVIVALHCNTVFADVWILSTLEGTVINCVRWSVFCGATSFRDLRAPAPLRGHFLLHGVVASRLLQWTYDIFCNLQLRNIFAHLLIC